MTHLECRLQERGIALTQSQLESMAAQCDRDTAIILSKGTFKGTNSGEYYSRMSSNGEVVVLIVRGRHPVTIMFRRANQGMLPKDMNVHNVRDMSSQRSR